MLAATGGPGSAVYASSSNASFDAVGLISVSNPKIKDFDVIDASVRYLLLWDDLNNSGSQNAGESYWLMKSNNAGSTWTGILNYTPASLETILGVYPSPLYASDSTLYLPLSNGKMLKTTNGGWNFSLDTLPGPIPATMTAFTAKDGNTAYAAYNNKTVYKSGRSRSLHSLVWRYSF